ncbi:MAG: MmcQ/YjbR family DNA-binding protein [Cellvibrio sp.]|uniref:MmcQ/YjbR family DNA-binding protein n=1 Tax=Cellvibrio sp. TaxID=1965322 RepID=UPI00271C88C1|nr:MmcQ/YjbR family DNA-binding protein [Cellvibrio sp.]
MAFDVKKYLLNKPEAVEDFPFGPEVAVYKIRDKIFALIGVGNNEARINLKCDPAEAEQLRMVFDAVLPGYHMNKKHWNTVIINGSLPDSEVQRMIDNSYALIVKKLGKSAAQHLLK